MAPEAPRPKLPLHYPDHLSLFSVPLTTFLKSAPRTLASVASAAVVFDTTDRLLLVQRAPTDSQPGLWESPGGGVDLDDSSILFASSRELWEEAGLVGTNIIRVIPVHAKGAVAAQPELAQRVFPDLEEGKNWDVQKVGSFFTNRSGSKILLALSFQYADVEPGTIVTLDPMEHQDYRWVTEEEMLREVTDDGFPIPIAGREMKPMLQQAFKIRRESGEMVTVAGAVSPLKAKRASLISFMGGESKRGSFVSQKSSGSDKEKEKEKEREKSESPVDNKRSSWLVNKRLSFFGENAEGRVSDELKSNRSNNSSSRKRSSWIPEAGKSKRLSGLMKRISSVANWGN